MRTNLLGDLGIGVKSEEKSIKSYPTLNNRIRMRNWKVIDLDREFTVGGAKFIHLAKQYARQAGVSLDQFGELYMDPDGYPEYNDPETRILYTYRRLVQENPQALVNYLTVSQYLLTITPNE